MGAAGAGAFVLFFGGFMALSIAGLVFWVLKLIEIVKLDDQRFRAAGTDKTTWVLVVALVGWIGALIWHFSKRSDVLATPVIAPLLAPPGWYPESGGALRWWDGVRWTDHRQVEPPRPG